MKLKNFILKVYSIIQNFVTNKNVYFVVETQDWVIKEHTNSILKILNNDISASITYCGYGIKNSIIHYATEGVFFNANRVKNPHKSNKVIVTWYHINDDDPKLKLLEEADKFVDVWQTSCTITKNKLIKYGINSEKIILIPLAIDLNVFHPLSLTKKNLLRHTFGIEENTIVIGSFQKDGIGWDEGLKPKLEKGPDIFCDIVQNLAKQYNIFVCLTGPSRGYVKKRLQKANIPFYHEYLKDPNDVIRYFQICDLYIISSREEGGPKALLEAMACAVPLVSTNVGMVPDVIEHGKDGYITDIEKSDEISYYCQKIIEDPILKKDIVNNALLKVKYYNYQNIAQQHSDFYKKHL